MDDISTAVAKAREDGRLIGQNDPNVQKRLALQDEIGECLVRISMTLMLHVQDK